MRRRGDDHDETTREVPLDPRPCKPSTGHKYLLDWVDTTELSSESGGHDARGSASNRPSPWSSRNPLDAHWITHRSLDRPSRHAERELRAESDERHAASAARSRAFATRR